jgi:tRNA-dihydrouridine synthase B
LRFNALVNIGNIKLGNKPLFLAPMEDVTDGSFRFICKHFGADMVYTEFIPADGLIRNAKKSRKKLEISDDERPIGIQLYGHIIESMVEASLLAEEAKPDLIDINYGCPVRKIANRGAGSGMLCNIPLMVEMTKAIVDRVKLPITVKTRLGWDDGNRNITDIAERLQDAGISAITIHGRTRSQFYKGNADWALIGEVKNNPRMKIPVIGNGDIFTPQSAKEAFDRYGVDGIMIGRAAIGRPWIFQEIRHFLKTSELLPPMTVGEKVEYARIQFRKSIEVKGIPRGIFEMRRHFSNYFKNLPDFREIRMRLVTSLDTEEIEHLLDKIRITYQQY